MEHFDIPQDRGLRLELLVGRTVIDAKGRRVGRIRDIIGDRSASGCSIVAVLIAPARLLDFAWLVASAVGRHHDPNYRRIPWDALDLSDPRRPRLRGDL